MRQFARPFPLERLSLEARVLYSVFLVFLAAGIGSSVWLYASSFGGLGSDAAAVHYSVTERRMDLHSRWQRAVPRARAPSGSDEAGGGPALELPEDEVAAPSGSLQLGQSNRQVMETFHFHLFTIPVVLLIVGHLFMLTSLATRLKIGVISLASIATFAHVLAPLLVRFGSAGFAPLLPASAVVAALGWLPMVIWPLWEMWWRLPAKVESALS